MRKLEKILIVSDLNELNSLIRQSIFISFIILIVALIVSYLISSLISRPIVNPIRELTAMAEKMAKGDLSQRIDNIFVDKHDAYF